MGPCCGRLRKQLSCGGLHGAARHDPAQSRTARRPNGHAVMHGRLPPRRRCARRWAKAPRQAPPHDAACRNKHAALLHARSTLTRVDITPFVLGSPHHVSRHPSPCCPCKLGSLKANEPRSVLGLRFPPNPCPSAWAGEGSPVPSTPPSLSSKSSSPAIFNLHRAPMVKVVH